MAAFLQVVLSSIVSVTVLFFITKWLGNRQMSQLTLFDYITGISIGSIAAEIAVHPDEGGWVGLVALVIYGGVTGLINVADNHSLGLRRFILGEPLVLFSQGTLYFQNLKKAKLDLTEFLTECRASGYFDLSQLQLVILEVNGKFSFLPLVENRPLTPSDMGQAPAFQEPALPVILDGRVVSEALHSLGFDENWLRKEWEKQGFTQPGDILLGMASREGDLTLYEKTWEAAQEKF